MNEMNHEHHEGGCPGSKMMQFAQNEVENAPVNTGKPVSRLAQWPCQIKLVPTQAPFFDGAKLLKTSGKFIPWQVVTISRDGKILD